MMPGAQTRSRKPTILKSWHSSARAIATMRRVSNPSIACPLCRPVSRACLTSPARADKSAAFIVNASLAGELNHDEEEFTGELRTDVDACCGCSLCRNVATTKNGRATSDTDSTANVNAAVNDMATLDASSMEVATANGVVHLSGFVSSHAQVVAATDVARSVAGATAIR